MDTQAPVEAAPVVEEAKAPETVEAAPAVEKRKYKIKTDGIEEELELTDEEIKTYIQKGKGADKKFQEAAMTRKQAEEFIHLLRTNPLKVLTNPNLGIEFRKIAEEFLASQLEEEMLDPKERELREAKRKLAEIEDREKKTKAEQEESQRQELVAQYTNQITRDITSALQASGLPKTERTVARMAYYLHQGVKQGMKLKAADVIELVRQDYQNDIKSLFGALDGDVLAQIMGEDLVQKLRKWDLARVAPQEVRTKKPSAPSPKKPKQKMSVDEWRAKLEERYGK